MIDDSERIVLAQPFQTAQRVANILWVDHRPVASPRELTMFAFVGGVGATSVMQTAHYPPPRKVSTLVAKELSGRFLKLEGWTRNYAGSPSCAAR